MNRQFIIEELKKGNQKLLTMIYIKYQNQFLAYGIKRYPIDYEDLREIYQDVILAFYNNILEGRLTVLTSSLKSYLFEIGKHKIFKYLRVRNFEVEYSDKINDRFSFIADDHQEAETADEISEYIRNELGKLGEKCYKILKMFYFEKLKMEDIARAMNFSNVDSAKTQKYKCFEKLRTAIKENFPKVIQH